MSGTDKKELEQAFKLLDKNGDGFVTAEEARDFFAGSDERLKAELEAVIKNCDKDGNGSLDKSEFRAMWEFLKGGSEELEAIREDFQRLDLDGNGYISRDEVMTALKDMSFFKGDREEEAKKCISDMDADGDGRVSFPEFLLAWKFKY